MTACPLYTGAGGVAEAERVLLLPVRLGVLEEVGVLRREREVEGRGQVMCRHLLSVGDYWMLGRRVACKTPPISRVGLPMREVEQMKH
jgi:hypothetical protein